jgi:hypothetical protein
LRASAFLRDDAVVERLGREAWEIVKLGWTYVAGIALGVVAIVAAIRGSHDSGWFWGFWAMTALFVATGWRLHRAVQRGNQLEAALDEPHATAQRLEVLVNEGERLLEEMPRSDASAAEWREAVLNEGLEAILKHWALGVESELRRNAPQLLTAWHGAQPPGVPAGQGWATAANARQMVGYNVETVREMARGLRDA